MTRNPNGSDTAGGAHEAASDAAYGDSASNEDRSPRPDERRSSEPGIFEQFFSLLRPKVPLPLREKIVEALSEAEESSGFTGEEQAMLNNILGLHEVRVEDAMVPRSEIEAVEIGATLNDLLLRFRQSGHSRLPVYGEGLDDPRGMVHIRDVIDHVTECALGESADRLDLSAVPLERPLSELGLIRKVLFVPPSMPALELLTRMKSAHIQIALVIDEYGGTDGLVSMEDLLEIVVGDIEDEHDDEERLIEAEDGGGFLVDARAGLYDVRDRLGPDFDVAPYADEADTIGGLAVLEYGDIPPEGAVIEVIGGYRLEILEADSRRVRRLRIHRQAEPERGPLAAQA
ncbi:CBS domain-containing protein [Aureimonas frigidaquae]|uniref:CBS domain-containing protein n=1 Tax=Aureimonas frigidaquae TaxID=424757 RepID=UPI0009F9E43B|nr:hemolysin family protein [Aureimonas frigidaquae]